ncbi:MAG: nitroreductase [Rhodocyclaceae bacterium]|nr:nitroreductase [Rhodocyclaceae bacterium]
MQPDPKAIEIIDSAITSRRSIRAFLPTPVAKETVAAILRVASRAPSGVNIQPWRVYVLAGQARDKLVNKLIAAHDAHRPHDPHEYHYYPEKWEEPYLSRRRKVGADLYGLLGIGKGDTHRMHDQWGRNYKFFDAPVGMIFTIDRRLGEGSLLDYGMFMENIMIAARARGLDTCAQESFGRYHTLVTETLGIPAGEMLVCGMALGYADPNAPENRLVTEREPVEAFADFRGFE